MRFGFLNVGVAGAVAFAAVLGTSAFLKITARPTMGAAKTAFQLARGTDR